MPATIPAFDLYAELGVDASVTPEALESAYRALVKRHHPDLAGQSGVERTKRLNAAYAWLRDPIKRRTYDEARRTSMSARLYQPATSAEARWTPQHDATPTTPWTARKAPATAHAGAARERPRNQEGRTVAVRLAMLAVGAVVIAIAMGALQNGGSILGGRQPAVPPLAIPAPASASAPAASMATPFRSEAPTVAATVRPDAILQGNHPYWSNTGIQVAAGERFRVIAAGEILWDPGVREPTVGPGGGSWTPENVASPDEFLFQQSPIASLIGEVNGKMFWIGATQDVTAPASGELRFAMNERWVDGAWDDNQGSWAISVDPE